MNRDRTSQIANATIIRDGNTTYTYHPVGKALELRRMQHESINAAKREVRKTLKAKGGFSVALKSGDNLPKLEEPNGRT